MDANQRTHKILLLADTHLGYDLPFRPRIQRRRRGYDFFNNFESALKPALRNEVDLVVHGGDLFFRSKVPPALVEMAMAPLIRVAESGVPVLIVPGNHERGRIPSLLWAVHPNVHIFDVPRTFIFSIGDMRVAFGGFPFSRNVRSDFKNLVSQTGLLDTDAEARFLCLHQAVEGAQVGAHNYTFRQGKDVIIGAEIPEGLTAVLSGHIHRTQVLTHDLQKQPLKARVIYPGSIERTSFAERDERKGYLLLSISQSGSQGMKLVDDCFIELPTRPMIQITIDVTDLDPRGLEGQIKKRLATIDPNAVVRLKFSGDKSTRAYGWLSAAELRALAPQTMNVSLAYPRVLRQS